MLVVLLIAMISQPDAAYDSAVRGLLLWWEIVTPALLPFFFLSELLMEMNISSYLRRAMSPLMRPLFNLPGAASLAVALGFCSGFPSGAAITAGLRRKGEISREEGERLICFTNNAGPLYISVALAGGLLHCPKAAMVIALAHYGGNLLLGISMGILARRRKANISSSAYKEQPTEPPSSNIELKDFGSILKAAIKRAAANIITIGCLMTFFAVTSGLIMQLPLPDNTYFHAFIQGFWEMSLGVNALADSHLSLSAVIPAAVAVISFGGVSVQMQVLSMVADTDIRIFPYLLSRVLHALLGFGIARLLCSVISLPTAAAAFIAPQINLFAHAWQMLALGLFVLLLVSLLTRLIQLVHLHHRS